MNGHQPDRSNTESLQVIQFLGDAVEVTNAVAVGIIEGADKNLVEDRVMPPSDRFDLRRGSGRLGGSRLRRSLKRGLDRWSTSDKNDSQ